MMKKRTIHFSLYLIMFFAVSIFLPAWEPPIVVASESGKIYEDKTSVQFHPSGAVYICSMAHNEATGVKDIYLFKYTGIGSRAELVKNVSTGGKKFCYRPEMNITKDGTIHVVWAEAVSGTADEQYIMYRSLKNGNWSPRIVIAKLNIPGTLDPTGFNRQKVDDLNFAVDSDENIFVAFMIWPAGRCRVFSKYGTVVTEENWPMAGRTKHPCVRADDNNVHLIWQQMLGSVYTIYYAKRQNIRGALWHALDVKGGAHRPVMDLDQNGNTHAAFMMDDQTGRSVIYKYWMGNKFSNRVTLSEIIAKYQNVEIAVKDDKNMIVVAAIFKGSATEFLYNWKKNGNWHPTGLALVPLTSGKFDNTSAAISNNDNAAFVYSVPSAVFMILFDPITINEMPVPVIESSVDETYWKDTVDFDGSASTDKDGSIVKHAWNFGDGETAEGAKVSHQFAGATAYGDLKIKLTVTDDKGATASVTKIIKVKPLHAVIASSLNELFWRETVIFYGTDSVCADGSIVKYEWNFGDGETASGVQVAHQFASATAFGDLPVKLTVTDDKGATESATKIIKVKPRPFPVIKSDKDEIFWQETVAFDGRSSLTVDSAIVAYAWNFGDGEQATGSQVTHKFANSKASGDLSVQLTVTNAKGVSAVASKTIKVKPRPFPVISSNLNEIFWQDTVVFDGSKTLVLPGFTVRYGWDFGDGEYGEGMQVSHQFKNASAFGDKQVKLTVIDNKNVSASASKTIKVKALYSAPFTFLKIGIRTISYDRWSYKVSWTANAKNAAAGYNIVKYRILRKPVSGSADYSQVADVDASVNSYLDMSIDQAVDYVYAVCALDASGHVSPVNNL